MNYFAGTQGTFLDIGANGVNVILAR